MRRFTGIDFFLLIILSFNLVSCSNTTDELNVTFKKAERCMDSRPDSSLAILRSIPHPEKLHGKAQADYALLMTQAMDKNFIKFTSDSLILNAVSYYSGVQNYPFQKGKSLIYYGRVLRALDEREKALKAFLNAKSIYDGTKEYKMLGLVSDEIGMVNRQQLMYGEALNSFRKGLLYYKLAKDSFCVAKAYQNIGRVYLFSNNLDSAQINFKFALDIASKNNYQIESSILQELGVLFRSKGDFSKAEFYILSSIQKEKNGTNVYLSYLSLGYLYLKIEKLDLAKKYLHVAAKSQTLSTKSDVYTCLYQIEKAHKNYEQAIIYHDKADSINKIIVEQNSQAKIAELQKKFENEKLQKENLLMKVTYRNIFLWGAFAFFLVILLSLYLFSKNRNNKKKIEETKRTMQSNEFEINRYREEINNILKSKDQALEENQIKVGELNGKVLLLTSQNKILSKQLKESLSVETVDNQIETTFEQYKSAFYILIKMKEGNLKLNLTVEDWDKLFALCDWLYNNYISRLQKEYSLTKHNAEVACLLKFGFSNEELSRVFNTIADSATKAKGRLKQRLGIPSQNDLEDFLRKY